MAVLTDKERQQARAELDAQLQNKSELRPDLEPEELFSFRATLFEYPLLRTHPGNEVQGETDEIKFVLTKDEKNSDLYVTLSSKTGFRKEIINDYWRIQNSFMHALALANGIHAWPYRIEYRQLGKKVIDRVGTACKLGRTSHAPFSDNLAFQTQTGQLSWNWPDVLKLAFEFFLQDTTLSNETTLGCAISLAPRSHLTWNKSSEQLQRTFNYVGRMTWI